LGLVCPNPSISPTLVVAPVVNADIEFVAVPELSSYKLINVNDPASFSVPRPVTVIFKLSPTSLYVVVELKFHEIFMVGKEYVGNTVGNSKSSNKSTSVLPVKLATVVPALIPPTS